MNGAVAAISIDTGRIIDVELISRYCQGCVNLRVIEGRGSNLYKTLKKHKCTMNHEGSAPKKELDGVVKTLERFTSKHNLRYSDYCGDGDTKCFSTVKDIYDGITVSKKECIGHVQKRVGNRLRKLKKSVKGLDLM